MFVLVAIFIVHTMTREDENYSAPTDQMLSEDTNQNNEEKKDKYYMTYLLFYSLGTISMFNVNFYTTATDYWMYKFRDINDSADSGNRTKLQAEFIADYSIVSNVGNIIFFVLTITLLEKLGVLKRIIGSLCSIVVVFTIVCAFILINTDSWQYGFFIFSLIMGFLLTGFCAILQITVFNMAASFPAGYVAAIPAGLAICGISSGLLQVIALSIGASSTTTGFIYFLAGLYFVFQTLVFFSFILFRSDFFKYYAYKKGKEINNTKITKDLFFTILKKFHFYFISIMVVLGGTIMIHPGVTALVVSMDKGNGNRWNEVFFVPVITFLLYNICDYVGRECARIFRRPNNDFVIFLASCCRLVFVPLLLFCNAQPRSQVPVVFDKDFVYIIFMIFFGFTGGYLVNASIIQVHKNSKIEEKRLSMLLVQAAIFSSLSVFSFIGKVFVNVL